jgi:CDP-diacylglycerol--glycerol-3-phosphate 3-phosphatidyltransferase
MKGVGMMERAERITLLAAPQALFGLALDGLLLRLVFSLLAASAIVTAVQRIAHVRWATQPAAPAPTVEEPAADATLH